ncbi:MAG: hypothetical protein H8J66_01445 [Nitrospira sp.]|nr:hypothetical protein [Nitrospira sp.]
MSNNKALIIHMGSKPEQLLRGVVAETLRLEAADGVAALATVGAHADTDAIVDALAAGTNYKTILAMPEVVRWPAIAAHLQTEAEEERRVRRALVLDFDTRDGVTLLTRDRETYVLTASKPDQKRTFEVLTVEQVRAYLQGRGVLQAFISLATDPAQWPAQSSGGRSWFQTYLK